MNPALGNIPIYKYMMKDQLCITYTKISKLTNSQDRSLTCTHSLYLSLPHRGLNERQQ